MIIDGMTVEVFKQLKLSYGMSKVPENKKLFI